MHLAPPTTMALRFRPGRSVLSKLLPRMIDIEIDAEGQLAFEGEPVGLRDMRARLSAVTGAEVHVRISGDHLIPWRSDRDDQNEMLCEVLDLCWALRLWDVTVLPHTLQRAFPGRAVQ